MASFCDLNKVEMKRMSELSIKEKLMGVGR